MQKRQGQRNGWRTSGRYGSGRKQLTIDELEYIHKHKTGKLLEFAVLAGSILSDATEEQEEKLLEFAKYIGLAFQIRDDILDVEGTEEEIGKPIGSDVSNEKSTYTTLFTVDRAKDILDETIAKAKMLLVPCNYKMNIYYLFAI